MKMVINNLRKDMIKMTYAAGKTGAHIGPALSLTEILAVLYFKIMNFDPKDPTSESRDRLILSKGHGVIAQYAVLKELGLIKEEELQTFKTNNTRLYAHPSMNPEIGVEFSSGSLGQGLSLGVGVAIALKHKGNNKSKVYVIVGDGECNEGSVWEAIMSAVQFELDNIVIVVDKNNIQYDDFTKNIISMEPLEKRFETFGCKVACVDGHNIEELEKGFKTEHNKKPLCVIANTVKGKGVSFMENEPKWHNNVLTEKLYNQAMSELGEG